MSHHPLPPSQSSSDGLSLRRNSNSRPSFDSHGRNRVRSRQQVTAAETTTSPNRPGSPLSPVSALTRSLAEGSTSLSDLPKDLSFLLLGDSIEEGMGSLFPGEGVPHHQLPNYSSLLTSFGNEEEEWIRQAYAATSFTSLRELPNNVRHGEVFLAKQQQILNSKLPSHQASMNNRRGGSNTTVQQSNAKGLFQPFQYVSSRYNLSKEMKTKDRLIAEAKRMEIGGKTFVPSSTRTKLKYEDAFEDASYLFPYRSDQYEMTKDQILRERWIQEQKIIGGPFIPAGKNMDTSKPPASEKPYILSNLRKLLHQDWEEAEFQVVAEQGTGLIVVRFDVTTVDSHLGLSAYMNVLASSNQSVLAWGLRRLSGRWNMDPGDGHLYYCFIPPWTRNAKLTADKLFPASECGSETSSRADIDSSIGDDSRVNSSRLEEKHSSTAADDFVTTDTKVW